MSALEINSSSTYTGYTCLLYLFLSIDYSISPSKISFVLVKPKFLTHTTPLFLKIFLDSKSHLSPSFLHKSVFLPPLGGLASPLRRRIAQLSNFHPSSLTKHTLYIHLTKKKEKKGKYKVEKERRRRAETNATCMLPLSITLFLTS